MFCSDFWRVEGDAWAGDYLRQCGIEPKLLDLINLRVSRINGCAYCIDMHWKALRAAGESEQRLDLSRVPLNGLFHSATESCRVTARGKLEPGC